MSGREEVEPYCGMCECTDVSISQEDYTFDYGIAGPDQVELTVEIPVFTCNNKKCGFQWWNWEAGEIIDAYAEQWKNERDKNKEKN